MSDIESRILEYLLNSLWQVSVIFAAGWIAARMALRSGPQMEHRVWVSALMMEAALPACRFRLDDLLREVGGLVLRGSDTGSGGVRVVLGASAISGTGMLRMPREALAGVAAAYGCGLMYFAGRLGWGLWRTRLMTKQAECVTLTAEAMRHWERYAKIFGCEAARMSILQNSPVATEILVERSKAILFAERDGIYDA